MRGCFSTSTPQRENSRVPGHQAGPQIVRFSGHGRTSSAELTYHIIMRRQFATTAADVLRHAYLLDSQNPRGVFSSANGVYFASANSRACSRALRFRPLIFLALTRFRKPSARQYRARLRPSAFARPESPQRSHRLFAVKGHPGLGVKLGLRGRVSISTRRARCR